MFSYVPRIDRATPREFCKGGVKPGSQYVAQQCGSARCGLTQAPRRAFNCASVFTILIKSAQPHPLYPRVRIDFIGLAASAASRRAVRIELGSILAARRDSWALECSKIVTSDAPCRATSRRVAVRRILNQPKLRWGRGRPCACSLRSFNSHNFFLCGDHA